MLPFIDLPIHWAITLSNVKRSFDKAETNRSNAIRANENAKATAKFLTEQHEAGK